MRRIMLSCLILLICQGPLLAGYKIQELRVNEWYTWDGEWQTLERVPGKSFRLYRVFTRPGETYAISLEYRSSEAVRFTLGYSDQSPAEPLLSTNSRSSVIFSERGSDNQRNLHNRILKISEKSQGSWLHLWVAVDEHEEFGLKFGLRVAYLDQAGLSRKNQGEFIHDGQLVLDDHKIREEEMLIRPKGAEPLQEVTARIPILEPQNGYFFPKNISQILIPRDGLLTRGGSTGRVTPFEKDRKLEDSRIFLVDSEYALTLRVYVPEETFLTVWMKTYSDDRYFWGSREIDFSLNREKPVTFAEAEATVPAWTWQNVGRHRLTSGVNYLKFRKKVETGAMAVIERVLLTRDPHFKPSEYDRANNIEVAAIDPAEEETPSLESRKEVRHEIAGKWSYTLKNKKHTYQGHVMITQQPDGEIQILGFARRAADQKSLSWVEKGRLENNLLLTRFENRFTRGRATYNIARDEKSLYGTWSDPGNDETRGVIRMARAD